MVWRMAMACLLLLLASATRSTQAMEHFRAISILNDNGKEKQSEEEEASFLASRHHVAALHDTTNGDVQELFVKQPLDHFSTDDTQAVRYFKQRYFYTERYATRYDNSVGTFVFLCVGGEGPSLTKAVLIDSVHCTGDMLELARKLHEEQNAVVHLYALEHRYYGESYPVFCTDANEDPVCSPVTNEHLAYLSSRQALHDLGRFIKLQNAHLPNNTKWITFGGSYPGMLAAWARLLFPFLVHAAVSNSAPIQAMLEFPQYNDWVGLDTRYQQVGGSNECFEILVEGHEEIVQALQEGQHAQIADMFDVCNASSLQDERNVDMFVGDGVVEIPAQGNDPSCTVGLCNIEKLCTALVTERKALSTSMQALATVAQIQRYDKTECLTMDWKETLNQIANPRSKSIRSWLWQTCTEFGFYQTCPADSSWCPYGRGYHTIDMDLEICKVAFGVDANAVRRNVQDTLQYYGGWNLNATRVLSVNGDVDPWSVLALKENSSSLRPTHWVTGASHHFWTHAIKETDDAAIVEARNAIYDQVMEWLDLVTNGTFPAKVA